MSLNIKSLTQCGRLLLIMVLPVLVGLPAITRASIDAAPAVPSFKRIDELFGAAGLSEAQMVWPVAGPYRVSSMFGVRKHPINRKRTFHHGLDIAAPIGTPIVSVAAGRVVFAGWRSGFGYVVEVAHGKGWMSRYAHAKSISVHKGQLVLAGQMVAKVGRSGHATGTHLHLELERAGKRIDPMAFWMQVSLASTQ